MKIVLYKYTQKPNKIINNEINNIRLLLFEQYFII